MRFRLLLSLALLSFAAQFSLAVAADIVDDSLLMEQSQDDSYVYDAQGRRDPFTPLVQAKPDIQEVAAPDRPEKIKGPLEKYELSQFRLIAIVVIKGVPNAMVATPDGKSYRVKVGDYIGLKSGIVEKIETKKMAVDDNGLSVEKNPDRIVVVESGFDRFSGTKVTEKRYIEL
jgi:Tfp pilus assembly protein PilP